MNTSAYPSSIKIGVISGRFPTTTFSSQINHKAYCEKHGYTYIHCNWPTGAKNPYMNKTRYIQTYYHLFDYIFWIDDDAFFMDFEKPLTEFLPEANNFFSVCASPDNRKLHTYISSGQFFLTCNELGRAFIDAIELVNLASVKAWWPEELGYFSNGDQDAMVYLLKTNPTFSGYNLHHFRNFNSRVADYFAGDNVFILHFTGTPKVKATHYRQVQKASGFGPTLLPAKDKESLAYQDPKSLIDRILTKSKRLCGIHK